DSLSSSNSSYSSSPESSSSDIERLIEEKWMVPTHSLHSCHCNPLSPPLSHSFSSPHCSFCPTKPSISMQCSHSPIVMHIHTDTEVGPRIEKWRKLMRTKYGMGEKEWEWRWKNASIPHPRNNTFPRQLNMLKRSSLGSDQLSISSKGKQSITHEVYPSHSHSSHSVLQQPFSAEFREGISGDLRNSDRIKPKEDSFPAALSDSHGMFLDHLRTFLLSSSPIRSLISLCSCVWNVQPREGNFTGYDCVCIPPEQDNMDNEESCSTQKKTLSRLSTTSSHRGEEKRFREANLGLQRTVRFLQQRTPGVPSSADSHWRQPEVEMGIHVPHQSSYPSRSPSNGITHSEPRNSIHSPSREDVMAHRNSPLSSNNTNDNNVEQQGIQCKESWTDPQHEVPFVIRERLPAVTLSACVLPPHPIAVALLPFLILLWVLDILFVYPFTCIWTFIKQRRIQRALEIRRTQITERISKAAVDRKYYSSSYETVRSVKNETTIITSIYHSLQENKPHRSWFTGSLQLLMTVMVDKFVDKYS
ncbi:hypothetical protein ADUPG1_011358, partial [Aduncisulcus paluster]